METILNYILSVQLALGPYIMGSEVVRTLSTPPRMLDLSTVEKTALVDQETGEVIQIVSLETPAAESLAVTIYDSLAQVLFFPSIVLIATAPDLVPVFDQICDDYVELLPLTNDYLIIEDQPTPR